MNTQCWMLVVMVLGWGFAGCCADCPTREGTFTSGLAEEGIPTDEMLTLDPDVGVGTGAGLEGALVGQPSCVARHAHAVSERIQTARRTVRALIDTALDAPHKAVSDGPLSCYQWSIAQDGVQWRLRSCVMEGASKTYAFSLAGKAETAAPDEDYQTVMGGTNRVLPRNQENKKRGEGTVGYDFDAFNALTGTGPTGELAIEYRAAGMYRQMLIGTHDFQPAGASQAHSARYRFGRAIGKGGVFQFEFDTDVLSTDAQNEITGACLGTPDGLDENGAIGIAWRADGKARMASTICDGTLESGTCVAYHQCWNAQGTVVYQELVEDDPNAQPHFSSSVDCPTDSELPIPLTRAPLSSDFDTPKADPGLEGAR